MVNEPTAGQTTENNTTHSILCLEVLGTSFSITVDEDKEYLDRVLTQYKAAIEKTQSISGISNPLNIAILTGFLLCDEVNKIKQQTDTESLEVKQRTMKLIDALDQALKVCTDE